MIFKNRIQIVLLQLKPYFYAIFRNRYSGSPCPILHFITEYTFTISIRGDAVNPLCIGLHFLSKGDKCKQTLRTGKITPLCILKLCFPRYSYGDFFLISITQLNDKASQYLVQPVHDRFTVSSR